MADNGEYHIAAHAREWLDTILSQKGNPCGNCGAWRLLDGREIKFCAMCGDDAYDIYELAESAEDLPATKGEVTKESLIADVRRIIRNIDQMFIDAAYWNNNTRLRLYPNDAPTTDSAADRASGGQVKTIPTMIDIADTEYVVQVEISSDRRVMWVHVDGVTVLRIQNIPIIKVESRSDPCLDFKLESMLPADPVERLAADLEAAITNDQISRHPGIPAPIICPPDKMLDLIQYILPLPVAIDKAALGKSQNASLETMIIKLIADNRAEFVRKRTAGCRWLVASEPRIVIKDGNQVQVQHHALMSIEIELADGTTTKPVLQDLGTARRLLIYWSSEELFEPLPAEKGQESDGR